MEQFVNSTRKFAEYFNHPTSVPLNQVTYQALGLRVSLLAEELSELETAFFDGDRVGILDGLADLQYVTAGFYAFLDIPVPHFPPRYSNEETDDTRKVIENFIYKLKQFTGRLLFKSNIEGDLFSFQYTLNLLTDYLLEYVDANASIAPIFMEVHRSNMSKACASLSEAEETVVHYQSRGVSCACKPVGDKFIVVSSEGKILKSVKYSPPQLECFLN
jgi:predicted HAD superfamily Cof-like phosphohydrolase